MSFYPALFIFLSCGIAFGDIPYIRKGGIDKMRILLKKKTSVEVNLLDVGDVIVKGDFYKCADGTWEYASMDGFTVPPTMAGWYARGVEVDVRGKEQDVDSNS